MSDDSEMDIENQEYDLYRRKYQLLFQRCAIIQQENERLVNRIQKVRKLAKRRRIECEFLKNRLDLHGDDWRNATAEVDIKPDIKPIVKAPTPVIKTEKSNNSVKSTQDKNVKRKVKRKLTKSEKPERDRNAPKRPANPFFQFCQEQRTIVMERLNSELKPGEPEPSKQELTRQLAIKWKTLSSTDKQVYVDMYERSKEKYAMEIKSYNCKN